MCSLSCEKTSCSQGKLLPPRAQLRTALGAAGWWEDIGRAETPAVPTAAGHGSKTRSIAAHLIIFQFIGFQLIMTNIFSS